MPNLLLLTSRQWSYSITFIVTIRILNGAVQGVHFPSMISITSQVNGHFDVFHCISMSAQSAKIAFSTLEFLFIHLFLFH